MPAYNYGSTGQLRSRKRQLAGVAPYRLPTASMVIASQALDIVMSEEIITDGPSQVTDVDAAMADDMAAGSRPEDTAPTPASIMDDTAPTGNFEPSSEDSTPVTIIEKTIPGGTRLSTPIDGRTGQLSEETAPAIIMDDTTPTGDLAPASENIALASIVEDTTPGNIRPSTPIDIPTSRLNNGAAPASTIQYTILVDIETLIDDESSSHVNILDAMSAKAAVDDDRYDSGHG
ncbi:uncharacterized protein RCO7_10311 [Rhynchosporium graminicola]|uniref:Uncharacterized protein n=1 Tax=Rhynchosporium graminicola TaxID=2792576 RepID=A0A1E1LB74_9HELO|nr:uncharacterized protein RCO7_10311 [Rhynchosporium commune]